MAADRELAFDSPIDVSRRAHQGHDDMAAGVGLDGRVGRAARLVIPWRRSPSPLPSEPDAVAVRVVARVRVAVALIAAAVGSFVPDLTTHQKAAFLVVGLVWVPAASAVLFAADTDANPVAVYGGPLGDVAVLSVVFLLLPSIQVPLLFGYVAVVAFAAYTGGRLFGASLSAAAMAVILASREAHDVHRLEASTALLFAFMLVAIVFLLDRTTTVQSRTAARSARNERKSEAILARVADAVVVTDGAGCVVQWSPAAERILNRGAAAAIGHPCAEAAGLYVGERKLDCSNGCPLLALTRPDDLLGQEAWRPDADGNRQPLLVNVSAVPGPNGQPVEVVHSLRDVTRLKQAEEAKTLFLATASHELKTPLTVIAGFSATLLNDPALSEETKQMALEAINRRAHELSKIVDRLLLSSRIESGRAQVDNAALDVVPLIHERVEAVRSATGFAIAFDPDAAGAVAHALADQQAVITVVDHLLDNAIKYSPNREPVTVEVGDDDRSVFIAVSDHGVGMDDEQAAHCFDKFWQAESSDVRRFGGTGIGLYIVRSLVDAMGGHVEVKSAKGEGAVFTVSLPRLDAPARGADGDAGPVADEAVGVGERTSIREFMRQIGVPERSGS
jgi:two-component system, OmpR family, phosphate regulon sensor histidine kinase PhoR